MESSKEGKQMTATARLTDAPFDRGMTPSDDRRCVSQRLSEMDNRVTP